MGRAAQLHAVFNAMAFAANCADTWIKTVPGRGWFAYIRIYGPKQAAFDKTWTPADFEHDRVQRCPLLGVKQTSFGRVAMSASPHA